MNKKPIIIILAVLVLAAVVFAITKMIDKGESGNSEADCIDFYVQPNEEDWAGDSIELVDTNGELKWRFVNTENEEFEYKVPRGQTYVIISEPGPYVGIVENSEGCIDTFYIDIAEQFFEEEKEIDVRLAGPSHGLVGQELTFQARGIDAEKYEWSFSDIPGIQSTENNAKHVFETPGVYQIKLQINNGKYVRYKKVVINPERKPEVKTDDGGLSIKKEIANREADLKSIIKQIIALGGPGDDSYDGEKSFNLSKSFVNDQCCGDLAIEVNGKSIGELAFIRSLKNDGKSKNFSVSKVKIENDKTNNCYKKYKISGSFPGL